MSSLETIYPEENLDFCVYLTSYYGLKMPPLYIGSSSISKVNTGYRGSVASREWKDIWKQELKEHPELFNTIILSVHDTREEALDQELIMQKLFNVVKSSLFINKALASANGFFGMDTSGEKNYRWKKTLSEDIKLKISNSLIGIPFTEERKRNISNSMYGRKQTQETINKRISKVIGQIRTDEQRNNISKGTINTAKLVCPMCKKELYPWHYHRYNHGINCMNF